MQEHSSTGWAFPSRMWSSADFAVFVGAPSAVARDRGSGPSGHVNTSCMFICQWCAMATILANKPRSALTTTAVAVGLTVLDLTRFPNVCKLYFGNGAYTSSRFHLTSVSSPQNWRRQHSPSSLQCVSRLLCCRLLSLPMQCWLVAQSRSLIWKDLPSSRSHAWLCEHHFHPFHAWRASVFVVLTGRIRHTWQFSKGLQDFSSVVSS